MSKIRAVDAAGLDLVGDIDPIVIGRERVAGVELDDQPRARAAGGGRPTTAGFRIVVVEGDRVVGEDGESRAGASQATFTQRTEIAVGCAAAPSADWINWTSGVVDRYVAGSGSGFEKSTTTAVGGAGTLSRVLVPPLGGSSKIRLFGADDRRAVRRVGALERHARDVDGLGLHVEIDDEVFGGLPGGTCVSSSGLPAAVGDAGILQLGGVCHELVLPGGQAGQECQVDLPGVGEDEVAGRVEHGVAGDEGRRHDKLRLVLRCSGWC